MNNLGPWLARSFSTFFERPWQYCLLGLAWFGISFGASMVVMVPVLFLLPLAHLFGEWLIWAGMAPAIFVLWGVQGVAVAGLHRAIERLVNEGEWRFLDMLPYDIAFSSMGLTFFMATLSTLSLFFCMVPLVPIMGAWGLSMAVLAREGGGMFHALGRSWELSRDNFWEMCLYFFIAGLLFFAVSYIPLLGPFIAWPVMTLLTIVPYQALAEGDIIQDHGTPIEVEDRDPENPYQAPRQV